MRYPDLEVAISDASQYGLANQTPISNEISNQEELSKNFLYILWIVSHDLYYSIIVYQLIYF